MEEKYRGWEQVLEDLETLGYTREEGRKYISTSFYFLSPSSREEELELLGRDIFLKISPMRGTSEDTFTFSVSGHDLKKKVDLYYLKGRTVYFDPKIREIPAGKSIVNIKGSVLAPYIWREGKTRGEFYAAQKGWVFSNRSNRVSIIITKPPVKPTPPPTPKPKPTPPPPTPPTPKPKPTPPPPTPPVKPPVKPPVVPVITLRDLLPAPPPYPPLPKFLVERLLGRKIG